MKRKFSLLAGIMAACLCFHFAAMAAQSDDLLIRGQVNAQDGTRITFSAPLSLLETLKTSVKGPVKMSKDDIEPLVNSLIADFTSMKGLDIINVDAEDTVRVWVDDVDDGHPEEANFIKLNVKPAGEKEPEINIRIPKGLFFLISHIGNSFMEMHGEQLFQVLQHEMNLPIPPKMNIAEKEKEEIHEQDIDKEKLYREIREEILKEVKKSLKTLE